jgi:hypothetical protein
LHVWQGGCRWALPMGMWGIYNTAFAIFCKQTILTKVSKFVPDTATSRVVKIGGFQDFSPDQYQIVSVMGNGQCSSIDLWRGFAYQFQFYLGVFFMKQVFDAIACEAVESPSCGWFNIRQMPHNCGLLFSSYRVTTHLNCLVCPWPPNWSLNSAAPKKGSLIFSAYKWDSNSLISVPKWGSYISCCDEREGGHFVSPWSQHCPQQFTFISCLVSKTGLPIEDSFNSDSSKCWRRHQFNFLPWEPIQVFRQSGMYSFLFGGSLYWVGGGQLFYANQWSSYRKFESDQMHLVYKFSILGRGEKEEFR